MSAQGPVLVIGLDPVGLAIVHRLHALNVPVQVLGTPREMARCAGELTSLGIEALAASDGWENDLQRLELARYSVLVLVADDDARNVDACLIIRRYHGEIPIAVRVSDPSLVRFLQMSVPHVDVYSMGSTTAPAAAELAMQFIGQGRPLPERPTRLAADAHVPRVRARLGWAIGLTLGAVLPVAALLAKGLHLGRWAALQLALSRLWHVDLGPAPALHGLWAGLALLLGVLGFLQVACAVGLVIDWLLTRRLANVAESAPLGLAGHVVVCGAGNIGARVAELLHKRKVRVVVIESAGTLRNVQRLRVRGINVVIGDVTVDETLQLAGAHRAAAALALTNSDAVNLHVGLLLSDKKFGIPTAVRILAPELAAHLEQHLAFSTISPVAETASHVCRTVERMRGERLGAKLSTSTTGEIQKQTGRFAGPEFDTSPSEARPALDDSGPGIPHG